MDANNALNQLKYVSHHSAGHTISFYYRLLLGDLGVYRGLLGKNSVCKSPELGIASCL
jgi:hypothetical protein